MSPHSMEQAIMAALQQAKQDGQPVNEIIEAVKRGEELDAWFEPKENGLWTLNISVSSK